MTQSHVPPSDSFFARLQTCVVSSFVLLIAATVLKLPPWAAMVGGGLPLVYYHVFYLRPRAKKGLSQTAIDSVYYFGFLVTIAALGVSAVSLAVSGGKVPLDNIAFQFGLGLLATGYAVLARMHLTSISTWVDEATPEAVLDRYIVRSRELVTNVELASTQFVELSTNLMTKSQEVAETARATTEKSMLAVASQFDKELRGTLASARAGLTEIRGLVNEVSFVQEREALVRSIKVTLDAVTEVNKALGEFALRSGEGARTSQAVAASSSALNDTLTTFHASLSKISAADGPLLGSAKSLGEAQTAVTEGTQAIGRIVEELGQMAGSVSGIGLTYKAMKALTIKANEQMEALTTSAERLDNATKHITRSADATKALAQGVESASAALPAMGGQVEALDQRFEELAKTVMAVETQLGGMPRPVEAVLGLSADLTTALKAVADVLAAVKDESKALAGSSLEQARALEIARKAAGDTDSLHATARRVGELLDGLGITVDRLNTSVSASTTTLKTALDTATSSLDSDVRRSTETARMFTERLAGVAQIIIDKTQDGRRQ
jgi:hypothetical protein